MISRPNYVIATLAIIACLAACSDDKKKAVAEEDNEPEPPVWTFNTDSVELGTADFKTFDITPDYTEFKEKIYHNSEKNAYVENTPFEDVINIKFEGNTATVESKNQSDFKIKTDGAHVTVTAMKKVNCVLSGQSDNGSLMVMGDKKVCMTLDGVKLKNPKGPALNCQSKKECYVITNAASQLSDDTLYTVVNDTLQQKGCIFSEGKLAFGGTAPLKVVAMGADAVHSDKSIFVRRGTKLDIDSRYGDAIQAQHNIRIEGGMINISSKGRGAAGLVADSIVEIAGGRTIIISDTPGAKGNKNAKGIKCDSIINITGGIVRIKEMSLGGKGMRASHKLYIKNAMVDVLTFGNDDRSTGSKNKGVKGMDEVRIDSARVRIRCTNGRNEALESRRKIIINNSLIELLAHDDAVSVGEPGVADFEFNSGCLYSETMMDAIDSNGTIHINGGVLFAVSKYRGGRGFDCDFNEFRIAPDVTLVGVGNITSPPTAALLEHPACIVHRPLSDKEFALTASGTQENALAFKLPEFQNFVNGYKVLVSLPQFADDATYDICTTANVSQPTHTFHGLMLNGSAVNKSVAGKCTFAKKLNMVNIMTPGAGATTASAAATATDSTVAARTMRSTDSSATRSTRAAASKPSAASKSTHHQTSPKKAHTGNDSVA
ncbi:MAG: carbohydrate-binding domain-containing protein [Muribaculaceae bacterium]|nr:carbohydrate-binding domain-containing protein [Muribaculaceae bacterium]